MMRAVGFESGVGMMRSLKCIGVAFSIFGMEGGTGINGSMEQVKW